MKWVGYCLAACIGLFIIRLTVMALFLGVLMLLANSLIRQPMKTFTGLLALALLSAFAAHPLPVLTFLMIIRVGDWAFRNRRNDLGKHRL